MESNWITKNLGDLCEIAIGKTPLRSNSSYWDKEKSTKNVWLSIADLLNTQDGEVYDSKEYISNKGASLCKLVKKGTLMVSFKLTLGRLAFAGKDLYTNEAIASLTIKDEKEILRKYLFYYLAYFDWDGATKGDVKVKGKTLNKEKLKSLLIRFPESVEQQQIIVNRLHRLDGLIQNLNYLNQKRTDSIDKLRTSILLKTFNS